MPKFHRADPIPLNSVPVNPADPDSTWTFNYIDLSDEGMSSEEISITSADARKKKKKSKSKKKRRAWGY